VVREVEEHDCIRRILENHRIEVVAETEEGRNARALIRSERPDIAVIDVRLADMSGFDLLDGLQENERPHVVFIAEGNGDAVRAFEYHAVDFLVRPCTEERFALCVSALQDRVVGSRGREMSDYIERIVVKSRDRIYFVKAEDVAWIEAAADYVHVHADGKRHIVRAKIGEMERRLDPRRFVRIHRSTIVNLDRICELRPHYHGEYQVILRDNTELTLSRGYRSRFSQYLMNPV